MAFMQKDKHSRKDKLEAGQAGAGPEQAIGPTQARVVIHKDADGGQHMHFIMPNEGLSSSNPHLDALLAKLEKQAEEEAVPSR